MSIDKFNAGLRVVGCMSVLFASVGAIAQTATPATPATAASAPATKAFEPSRLRGAPTLEALARMKIAEKEAQARERYEKMFPPPPPPAASKPAAKPAPPRPVVAQEVPRTRRVLAIHGRSGQEVADIERGDGQIVSYSAGASFEGYRVRRISADGVVIESPPRPCPTEGADTKAINDALERAGKPKAATPVNCGHTVTMTVQPGSSFR